MPLGLSDGKRADRDGRICSNVIDKDRNRCFRPHFQPDFSKTSSL